MRKLYTLLLFMFYFFGLAQDQKDSPAFFPDALRLHLGKYNTEANKAYEENNIEKAQVLFDSLINNHIKGTKFEDYTLKTVERKKIKLSSFQKPVFLLTYASWCIPSKGEFQALSKLAQKYSKEVKFVILFWDKRGNIKDIAKKFNHNITVCYAYDSYKEDTHIIAHLKHSFGLPTSYFLDQDLKIVNLKRGGAHPQQNSSYVNAFTMNYNTYHEGLSSILLDKALKQDHISDTE
ncbi:TlpA disulfide reductase family protein [Flavobacterium sp. H122]|uniref:TlpA family protein disulfide reductase n=1 Tax=Flavobacterium sp. H122 TaxID=2529860 RepID=UPI0010A9DC72|nr:TlpA disulfide reductase family protein [Flavobacterium sp. H122]